ncbi:MAG TPA: hypothetical protein VGD60_15190 [Candidatus Acidoferrales bacterium]
MRFFVAEGAPQNDDDLGGAAGVGEAFRAGLLGGAGGVRRPAEAGRYRWPGLESARDWKSKRDSSSRSALLWMTAKASEWKQIASAAEPEGSVMRRV